MNSPRVPEARLVRRALPIVVTGIGMALFVYLSCRPWDLHDGPMIAAPFGRDFVNFWIGGHLALKGALPTLTDLPAYNRLVAEMFAHDATDSLIFSYPPQSLLVLAPLACLPYAVALLLWTGANLVGLAWVATRLARNMHWRFFVLATCLSPAALTMVLYGHFGGLIAVAVTIAVLDGERRPWLGGICLALLTIKPQFAVLLGIMLFLGGRWRCLAPACVAATVLIVLSIAIFGTEVWAGFLKVTMPAQSALLSEHDIGMLHTVVSIFFAATQLPVVSAIAWPLQAAVSAVALAAAVRALRRAEGDIAILLTVSLALVVALPYANHYDLAIAAPALTVLLFSEGTDTRSGFLRLVTWLIPPLAWHLNDLGLPLIPLSTTATLLDEGFRTAQETIDRPLRAHPEPTT